tara:strand:+ start:64 stop:747 length:684 start_codon:yes stop_codon:yes gene_type:complete
MDHGKKKMKMQEGGNTTRKKRGMLNKKRLQEEAKKKVAGSGTSKKKEEKKEISRKRFQAIFGPKKTTPKGPKMSDIMGGAMGPMGPLGGAIDSPKATVKRKKKIDLRKRNLAGQRMGQRKAGGQIKKMRGGGMLGDLDKDGTMSSYEKKRQSAIEASMAKQGKKGGGLMAAIKKVDAQKMYGGGMTKKKMMGGGMTVKKMKHGGTAGKCPRDGIAMRGKTKAGRKTT